MTLMNLNSGSSRLGQLFQNLIDKAVDQWCAQLHACVEAKGHHFEHFLQTSAISVVIQPAVFRATHRVQRKTIYGIIHYCG